MYIQFVVGDSPRHRADRIIIALSFKNTHPFPLYIYLIFPKQRGATNKTNQSKRRHTASHAPTTTFLVVFDWRGERGIDGSRSGMKHGHTRWPETPTESCLSVAPGLARVSSPCGTWRPERAPSTSRGGSLAAAGAGALVVYHIAPRRNGARHHVVFPRLQRRTWRRLGADSLAAGARHGTSDSDRSPHEQSLGHAVVHRVYLVV